MNSTNIGLHKSELDTPAYCIDVDVMDANIARMASFLAERGKQWRPHAKCHKSPVIARREIDAGAIGVTVAKVSKAEVYVQAADVEARRGWAV
jgi:3-hydroxy-D-aspartate aldolase